MGFFDNWSGLKTEFKPTPYNNQYNSCKELSNIQTINTNKPFEVTDIRGNLIGYFWYYGDSVDLIWDIVGEAVFEPTNNYVDVSQIIKYQTLTATIYDWRHNIIESITLNPKTDNTTGNVTAKLSINNELSKKLVKGNYRISLTLSNSLGYRETLFDYNSCIFEVR